MMRLYTAKSEKDDTNIRNETGVMLLPRTLKG